MTRPTRSAFVLLIAAALTPVAARGQAVPAVEPVRAVEPAEDLPYDTTGRRDPFRPPRFSAPSRTSGEPRTPLQRYEVGQLRLVAIIYNTGDPRAVVEDNEGLGYIVKAGTPIGPNGGEVTTIERGRVVIKENSVDYYGEQRINEVVMELRTAEKTAGRGKR
jgi:type IV pilus assembly protein PilP